jgi:serine/threonine protein kinase
MEGLERYKKIKDLGEGAQGNVIHAWDTLLERNVAIKSLHMSLTSDTLHVKRFKEEAKTLASLGHPSIVGVYEYIANSSGCHLMMEYFEGHPLDLYIRNVTGPNPEERTIDIFIKVLESVTKHIKHDILKERLEYDTLERWEQDLRRRFHSSALRLEMVKANKAFGHGVGVDKSLSTEQMATLESSWQGF